MTKLSASKFLEDLERIETQLKSARLLLDRQYLDPFKRMDEDEIGEIKGETRIFYD